MYWNTSVVIVAYNSVLEYIERNSACRMEVLQLILEYSEHYSRHTVCTCGYLAESTVQLYQFVVVKYWSTVQFLYSVSIKDGCCIRFNEKLDKRWTQIGIPALNGSRFSKACDVATLV